MSARSLVRLALLLLPALVLVQDALAIPAFARRYRVSCQLCHNIIPQLSPFGEQFASNGFRMASGEQPGDTISTGDELLALLRDLPLAVRLELYAQGYANGSAATDFETPYGVKLLSGGALTKTISYYFYTFLFERGDIGGVEDAFVYFNDIGGAPVDLFVGQFQVSDPLFKRELRLEFEDYAVYRARLGDVPVDLTYDRGITASADLAGFTLTGELLNGNGAGAAKANRRYDIDGNKSVFLHLTRDLAAPIRLGAMGYYGKTRSGPDRNATKMLGADGTITSGPVTLNGQYIYREDTEPTFTPGEPTVTSQGGFGELLFRPAGSRYYGFALYNRVTANRTLLDVRLGDPAPTRRYETISGGVGHLVQRSIRTSVEATYDLEVERVRFTVGMVLAF